MSDRLAFLRAIRANRGRAWLEHRNSVIRWGKDYWADWRRVIHSS